VTPRYAWPAAALLALALVPTLANFYVPLPRLEHALARRIPAELPNAGSAVEGKRDAEWVALHFGAEDFVSRRYGDADLFAARTYDAKSLFHHPENALTYGRSPTERRTDALATSSGPVTVRFLGYAPATGAAHLSGYVLLYGNRPIDEPYRFLFRAVPSLLRGERRPTTLLYLQATAREGETRGELETRLRALLRAAVEPLLAAGDDA
jgi:hypothetical protein